MEQRRTLSDRRISEWRSLGHRYDRVPFSGLRSGLYLSAVRRCLSLEIGRREEQNSVKNVRYIGPRDLQRRWLGIHVESSEVSDASHPGKTNRSSPSFWRRGRRGDSRCDWTSLDQLSEKYRPTDVRLRTPVSTQGRVLPGGLGPVEQGTLHHGTSEAENRTG